MGKFPFSRILVNTPRPLVPIITW